MLNVAVGVLSELVGFLSIFKLKTKIFYIKPLMK